MQRRVVFDGLNLSLVQGTGIATYTRVLTNVARSIGYEVGVLYGTRFRPPADPLLQEVTFFDPRELNRPPSNSTLRNRLRYAADQLRCYGKIHPVSLQFSGTVIQDQFSDLLATQDRVYLSRNLFRNAQSFYERSRSLVTVDLCPRPDIFHCTYALPLRCDKARNIVTIHDLVPLRLPFATMDNKRRIYGMLTKITRSADHIVTVSETSRRDIETVLKVPPGKITNTYQAVKIPARYLQRPEASVANYIEAKLRIPIYSYLLFYGAVEPKKNVARLIEAYLSSGVSAPLVIVRSAGWSNDELRVLLDASAEQEGTRPSRAGPSVLTVEHVDFSTLVNLIRGAMAVVFPSLYEGFGLPVLEAMTLGTPVLTSNGGALPEIAGDAAMTVDPYNVEDIERGIKAIVCDRDLRAGLSERGRARAAEFSAEKYSARVRALYDGLLS